MVKRIHVVLLLLVGCELSPDRTRRPPLQAPLAAPCVTAAPPSRLDLGNDLHIGHSLTAGSAHPHAARRPYRPRQGVKCHLKRGVPGRLCVINAVFHDAGRYVRSAFRLSDSRSALRSRPVAADVESTMFERAQTDALVLPR